MDFVEGLGDAPDVMEIPVDGIGRVEIFRGRMRITLTRVIERNGIIRERPNVTLVWSTQAWLDTRGAFDRALDLVLTNTNGLVVPRSRTH